MLREHSSEGGVNSEGSPMRAIEHAAFNERGSYGCGGDVYTWDGPWPRLARRPLSTLGVR
jgi:hypothetical protein